MVVETTFLGRLPLVPAELGKILIVRGGAIGDFILTLPVLAALRSTFPGVNLELLTYPRVAPLALAAGLVDRARSIEARPMASFFAKGGPLPTELADYFGGFAIIISYLFDPDRIFQENVARCSKAQFIAGPHRPDENGGVHATDAFLQPLVRLAIFDADPVPRLSLDACQGMSADHLQLPPPSLDVDGRSPAHPPPGQSWLAMHPGSGSERKNWPEARWQELIARLTATTGLRFLLVGGEAEGERLARLAAPIPPGRFRIAQSLPLSDVAVLLKQCAGFLGHDSGISHLAAAVGLRGLLLWGDTRREIWQPRAEEMRLLDSPDGLPALRTEDVLEAMRLHLGTF